MATKRDSCYGNQWCGSREGMAVLGLIRWGGARLEDGLAAFGLAQQLKVQQVKLLLWHVHFQLEERLLDFYPSRRCESYKT